MPTERPPGDALDRAFLGLSSVQRPAIIELFEEPFERTSTKKIKRGVVQAAIVHAQKGEGARRFGPLLERRPASCKSRWRIWPDAALQTSRPSSACAAISASIR